MSDGFSMKPESAQPACSNAERSWREITRTFMLKLKFSEPLIRRPIASRIYSLESKSQSATAEKKKLAMT
jgi:hypothetical protein